MTADATRPRGAIAPARGPGERPLLRGWSHLLAIAPAVAGAVTVVALTAGNRPRQIAMTVYGVALVLLFTVSAAYHRIRWSPRRRALLRRVDHATIFLMIAGTYTPIVFTTLDGAWRAGILTAIWTMSLLGTVVVSGFLSLPNWARVAPYLGTAWVAAVAIPKVAPALGVSGMVLVITGAVLYTLGAVAYAARRPDPWPRVFGYHEIFHLLVIAATALFYTAVVTDVVPYGRAA